MSLANRAICNEFGCVWFSCGQLPIILTRKPSWDTWHPELLLSNLSSSFVCSTSLWFSFNPFPLVIPCLGLSYCIRLLTGLCLFPTLLVVPTPCPGLLIPANPTPLSSPQPYSRWLSQSPSNPVKVLLPGQFWSWLLHWNISTSVFIVSNKCPPWYEIFINCTNL